MSEVILEVHDLYKAFGPVQAVSGISLSIKKGECLAILGPNGAGKTTTVEILEGLVQADRGEIFYFGENIKSKSNHFLEKVGVVLQDTKLYRKFTVKETLELFASFYKTSLPAASLLKSMQLEEKANARLETLSGGQKQRLYLACALVNNPDLLFLDEPTTGLDPQARRLLWDQLKELIWAGKSILLTTHYMDEAQHLADRVAIMDKGQIRDFGSPDELILKYVGGKVICIRSQNDLGDLAEIFEGRWFEKAKQSGQSPPFVYEISTTNLAKDLSQLTHILETQSRAFPDLEIMTPNLEDVFIKLTGRSIRND